MGVPAAATGFVNQEFILALTTPVALTFPLTFALPFTSRFVVGLLVLMPLGRRRRARLKDCRIADPALSCVHCPQRPPKTQYKRAPLLGVQFGWPLRALRHKLLDKIEEQAKQMPFTNAAKDQMWTGLS